MTSDAEHKLKNSSSLVAMWSRVTQMVWYFFVWITFKSLCFVNLYHYFWRPFYWFLIKLHHWNVAPVKFINFGYVCQDEEDEQKLGWLEKKMPELGCLEADHRHIRLYERILAMCPLYKDKLAGKDFLEVSCGHCGGLNWLAKAHNWKSCRGLDLNPFEPDGVRVIKGDACNMPLPDNSVDIVLNCEASHAYGCCLMFMKEVYRVLRPGGYICWADLRFAEHFTDRIYTEARDAGLKLVARKNIVNGVLGSLDIQTERYQEWFSRKWYTRFMKHFWFNLVGVPGYGTYNDLKEGRWTYYAACWQKPK